MPETPAMSKETGTAAHDVQRLVEIWNAARAYEQHRDDMHHGRLTGEYECEIQHQADLHRTLRQLLGVGYPRPTSGPALFFEEVTDDFVSAFDDGVYTGPFARLAAEILPEGVNASDPRVVKIVERCRLAARQETTNEQD